MSRLNNPGQPRPLSGHGMGADDYLMACEFCGVMCSDLPFCDFCEQRPQFEKDIDAFMLAMPTNWPSRGRHEARIELARKRSPEHIMEPWVKDNK